MKPLTVYKASAGSGKTFTLAVEYIKLLINNPLCFKNILAVTFTNKATEEMKLRILSQLYGIWKMLPESDVYVKAVCDSLDISAKQAGRQAGIALSHLIHNYHYFRVETIDSFFQSIMRNLARELDLAANLKIGLNDSQVEEQAVDQLIESLNSTSTMLQWLISYIFTNISENKGWNVISQIKKFGKTIFKDFYRNVSDNLNATVSQQDFFNNYTKQLREIKAKAQKRMAEYADIFERETANAGLTTMSYANKKNGIGSYFNKLRSNDFSDKECIKANLTKCLAAAENWAAKTSPDRDLIISLVNDKLMKLLHDAENDRPVQWRLYSTADCTLRHLDKLRLLNGIEEKVRQLNDEADRFLLSDTQFLLHSLIKDNDTPFIFEKAGCQLENIMIDEFQDTSVIQWRNFKVLLKECMSHYGAGGGGQSDGRSLVRNLIVGDVKQSIYRWRSGDWRLLNGIKAQFDNPEINIEVKSLQTNYRSELNIIHFNNCFFRMAASLEYERELETNNEETSRELLSAYSDVCQNARKGMSAKGLVKIKLLSDEEYEDSMLANIYETVERLLSAGVHANSIAIVIRYNRHIPLIADYFMEKNPHLKIVSDEAFRLDASLAVNTIIQALNLLIHPDDVLTKASLAVKYQKGILQSNIDTSEILIGGDETGGKLDKYLPSEYVKAIDELVKLPLFEIVEFIFSSFELDKLDNQNAYICALYDQISEFVSSNSGDISKFLEEWDETIRSVTIQSDEINGIRLISIHKSKGLEFDNVIIPFCDWPLEGKDTTLWCNPDTAPFNSLPIVPVDYNKKLLETIYAEDYRNEHIQNNVDNLNLLYVAFTRARKNLFIFGLKKKKKGGRGCRSELLLTCLDKLNDELEDSILNGLDEDGEAPITFEFGTLAVDGNDNRAKRSENVFLSPVAQQQVNIRPSAMRVEFRQSNKSREFISKKDGENERMEYIKTGNVLHKLFSTIDTSADIEDTIKRLEYEGLIYNGNLTDQQMRDMLSDRFSDKRVAEWFDPHWQVFNECSILTFDAEENKVVERRPDRVITDGRQTIVIDFKFGKPRNEHKRQIMEYVMLLEDMGYNNVQGCLWYVYTNEIMYARHRL